jgi:hypothetical protein
MMVQVKKEEELTDLQWKEMWKNFKIQAHLVLGDLRTAMNHKFDTEYQERCWGAIYTVVREQQILEKIILSPGENTGWTRDPIPVMERLIRAVVEIDESEFQAIPDQMEGLKAKAEGIMSVS